MTSLDGRDTMFSGLQARKKLIVNGIDRFKSLEVSGPGVKWFSGYIVT